MNASGLEFGLAEVSQVLAAQQSSMSQECTLNCLSHVTAGMPEPGIAEKVAR